MEPSQVKGTERFLEPVVRAGKCRGVCVCVCVCVYEESLLYWWMVALVHQNSSKNRFLKPLTNN